MANACRVPILHPTLRGSSSLWGASIPSVSGRAASGSPGPSNAGRGAQTPCLESRWSSRWQRQNGAHYPAFLDVCVFWSGKRDSNPRLSARHAGGPVRRWRARTALVAPQNGSSSIGQGSLRQRRGVYRSCADVLVWQRFLADSGCQRTLTWENIGPPQRMPIELYLEAPS